MAHGQVTEVPFDGLPTVVEVVRQRVVGLEAWRLDGYQHHNPGKHPIKPKTTEQRLLEAWLREVGSKIGADTDTSVA